MPRKNREAESNWVDLSQAVTERVKGLPEDCFNRRLTKKEFEDFGLTDVLKIEPQWDSFEIRRSESGGLRFDFYLKQGDKDIVRDIRLYGNDEI